MVRIYFWLNYLFHSSKERFLHNFRRLLKNWIFYRNSSGADLTKMVKFLYYLKLWKENIFWLNYLFHSSKERFLQKIRQFIGKLNFLTEIRSGADLTKIMKIFVLCLIVLSKHFLAKLFIPLIKRKLSPKF